MDSFHRQIAKILRHGCPCRARVFQQQFLRRFSTKRLSQRFSSAGEEKRSLQGSPISTHVWPRITKSAISAISSSPSSLSSRSIESIRRRWREEVMHPKWGPQSFLGTRDPIAQVSEEMTRNRLALQSPAAISFASAKMLVSTPCARVYPPALAPCRSQRL